MFRTQEYIDVCCLLVHRVRALLAYCKFRQLRSGELLSYAYHRTSFSVKPRRHSSPQLRNALDMCVSKMNQSKTHENRFDVEPMIIAISKYIELRIENVWEQIWRKKEKRLKPNGWRLGTLLRHIWSTTSKSDCVPAVALVMHNRTEHKRWAPFFIIIIISYIIMMRINDESKQLPITTASNTDRIIFLPYSAHPYRFHCINRKRMETKSSFRVDATNHQLVRINYVQSNLHHLQSNKFHLFVLSNSINEKFCLFIFFIFYVWNGNENGRRCEGQWMRKPFQNAVMM